MPPRALPRPAQRAEGRNFDAFEARLRPLWLRARAGDDGAYREALLCMAARLRGYLRRRLASRPDDVEDLVQEVLLALHLQRGTWDATVPVGAWMLAIARYKLIDSWRRRGRYDAPLAALDEIDEAELPTADGDGALAGRDLGVLLQALPSAQREAITLAKLEGLSLLEVSARTGASVAAVKVQVHRGLRRLADLVKNRP